MDILKSPFAYFGGKSKIASAVWERFGQLENFVEPFAGSLAVLLAAPLPYPPVETCNDKDGLLCNAWRAILHDPRGTAKAADWPVMECDLHARQLHLVAIREELTQKLEANPEYYDTKLAGWWLWGMASWISGTYCANSGPWVRELDPGGPDRPGDGLYRMVEGAPRSGVKKQIPNLSANNGIRRPGVDLVSWLCVLSERLRRVRVCCGDWSRVVTPSVTTGHGLTGVFLDPPYGVSDCDDELYENNDLGLSQEVRNWALRNGSDSKLRIALCGYENEHGPHMPPSWECVSWKKAIGYAALGDNQGRENQTRERIWFSPGCLEGKQVDMFRGKPKNDSDGRI